VLKRIFEPKREEMAGGFGRLHNEELHNVCVSPRIIRVTKSRMRWAGNVARRGEMRNLYEIVVGKSEGKRPRGRSMCRW
jgi:hypothetical protein